MVNDWIIKSVIALLFATAAHYGIKKLRNSTRLSQTWSLKPDRIVLTPVLLLIWIFAISYVADILNAHFNLFYLTQDIDRIRDTAVVCTLAWLALRWKKKAEQQWLMQGGYSSHDPGMVHALSKLFTVVIISITVLISLYVLGVNVVPLLAFGGIGAAAVGFAGKDVISNFFGGLMLYVTRPFSEGEEIVLPNENIQGVVENIGWYLTSLRDKEKRPVYLPNSLFSRMFVMNITRVLHRRIFEVFSIQETQIDKVRDLLENINHCLSQLDLIDHKMPKLVVVDRIGGQGLEISMEIYTSKVRVEEYCRVKQEVLFTIMQIFQERGIALSVPQTIVKLGQEKVF
ncbi:MAG: mechanosensitive ion channel family protein [Simkania sp.]|nr:mechanosensitive ion channel family protein [Simkania sp.]